MIFETKTITLKDGRTAILRPATAADAAPAVEWLRQTAAETDFILRVPEEVTMTPEQEAAFFERVAQSPYDMMIWCEVDGDDTIHVDTFELADAAWVSRQELRETYVDTGIHLTDSVAKFFNIHRVMTGKQDGLTFFA